MQAVTLEVILRAVFGVGSDNGHREELTRLLVRLLHRTSSVALQFGVFFAARLGIAGPMERIERENAELDELLLREIAEHGEDGDDILSLLKAARFEDGEPMSDREVRDQLVTLLLAGHETTATGLAWTFDLLLRHPDVHAELVRAVDADDDAYVRATVTEALRLRPVVPLAGRRLGTELVAGELHLPAGTDVTPAIWLTHTNPDLYEDPYAFRPERWLDRKPDTYAWVPFGGGVRRCLGAAFAELEMRVVLSAVLRRRVLQPVTTSAERVARRNVTFSPAKGTRLVAAPRAA
jgi:cytochrome P450